MAEGLEFNRIDLKKGQPHFLRVCNILREILDATKGSSAGGAF